MSNFAAEPKKLELINVPPLLEMFVQEGVISKDNQEQVVEQMQKPSPSGKSLFVGEWLVELGIMHCKAEPQRAITKSDVDDALGRQSLNKVEAALNDIQTIQLGETLETPSWLKPQWGNNGVNQLTGEITIKDGASASANMAQNILLIANNTPELADKAQPLILNLAYLTRGMINGDSARVPIQKMGAEWLETLHEACENFFKDADIKPKDKQGNEVGLKEFLDTRFNEINAALELTLNPEKGPEQKQQASAAR